MTTLCLRLFIVQDIKNNKTVTLKRQSFTYYSHRDKENLIKSYDDDSNNNEERDFSNRRSKHFNL